MAFLCKSAQQIYMLNVLQKCLSYQKKKKNYHCVTQETFFIGILQCGWPVSLDYISRIYNQGKID